MGGVRSPTFVDLHAFACACAACRGGWPPGAGDPRAADMASSSAAFGKAAEKEEWSDREVPLWKKKEVRMETEFRPLTFPWFFKIRINIFLAGQGD